MSNNSTIITKKKKLLCGCFDYNFSKGRCKTHATIEDTAKRILKYRNETIESDKEELWDWFKLRRKEMTGICSHCGNPSTKKDDDKFHFSIAHILPKSHFPSVANHPDNWVELCFWGNSCHTNMDNKTLDIIDMNCFDEIITKFSRMFNDIAPEEKRRIPAILLEYLKNEL
jgi:hypothetical protein